MESRKAASKLYKDGVNPKLRPFDLHQLVRVKNVRGGKEKWILGTIVAIKGPETYLVRVRGNNHRFVHANHLIPDDAREMNAGREKFEGEIAERNTTSVSQEIHINPQVEIPSQSEQVIPIPVTDTDTDSNTTEVLVSSPESVGTPVKVTRSGRVSKPPKRLDL